MSCPVTDDKTDGICGREGEGRKEKYLKDLLQYKLHLNKMASKTVSLDVYPKDNQAQHCKWDFTGVWKHAMSTLFRRCPFP